MKKNLKKLVAVAMSAMMVFGLASCSLGSTPNDSPIVEAPEALKEVLSVTVKYNGAAENDGYINVDLSAKTINIEATVRVKNDCEYTLQYTSSNPAVAEIDESGKITLKSAGETVITATAGNKSHSVALVVADSAAADTYAISVEGGSASAAKAKSGDEISLTVNAEKNQAFKGWLFLNPETKEPIEGVWSNGNVFRMPAQNVLVKAEFDVKTYDLRVVDATVKTVTDEDTTVTKEETKDGVTLYHVPADAQVTLVRNEEGRDETFVGWDYANQGNRQGEAAEKEYSFTMPAEDLSVFAVYSATKSLTFGDFKLGGTASLSKTTITAGGGDDDLQEMDGYRFTFSASSGGASGYGENCSGVSRFTTLGDGSQTIKIIYKNHSDYAVDIEFYASQYTTIAGTGVVTVPANSVKEAVLVADYGFHNPSFGLQLRKSIGGSGTVELDMVWELANTYPYGDSSFDVFGAEYVELYSPAGAADYPANSGIRNNVYKTGPIAGEYGGANVTSGSFGGRKNVNNQKGMTYVHTRDQYTDTSKGTRYIYAELNNLPAYDADDPYVTVYFRFINTNTYSYKLNFGLGTSTDVNNDTSRVGYDLNVEANTIKLFGIKIARSQADKIYFSIQILGNKASNEYNFAVQMMYNNKMGVKAADVVSKAQ